MVIYGVYVPVISIACIIECRLKKSSCYSTVLDPKTLIMQWFYF